VKKTSPLQLPAVLTSRHRRLPPDYVRLLSLVDKCTNKSETAWFVCERDYDGTSDSAYRWNEFEVQALEGAKGDEAWKREITSFWDVHLPILLSVRSGYSFLALRLTSQQFGAVVFGREPEYEEVDLVCGSFGELSRLTQAVIHGQEHPLLSSLL
jgi:hypothetical protein